jgi:cobyrinic acid a,c-diamide synthase
MTQRITRRAVAEKLSAFLHHKLSLEQLVDWAERALMEGEFSEEGLEDVRDVVARLGVADIRAFGLTWEECRELLEKLGYSARVHVTPK